MKIETTSVGLNFRPKDAKERAQKVLVGERIMLVREPDNPYDANAVQVHIRAEPFAEGKDFTSPHEWTSEPGTPQTCFVGFVPKSWSAVVAEYLDKGCDYEAQFMVLPNIISIDLDEEGDEEVEDDEDVGDPEESDPPVG